MVRARQLDCAVQSHRLRIHLLEFRHQAFHPTMFGEFNIACPASIERSVPKRQAEYFFGRYAARLALAETGRLDDQIGTAPDRAPVWPPGVVGTITHSDTRAAACVRPACATNGVGIDIEVILSPAACAGVDKVVLSDGERAVLGRSGLPYPLAVTLAFSAKESLYKALYGHVGRYIDFSAVRIESIDPAGGGLFFSTTQRLSPAWPCGASGRAGFMLLGSSELLTWFAW